METARAPERDLVAARVRPTSPKNVMTRHAALVGAAALALASSELSGSYPSDVSSAMLSHTGVALGHAIEYARPAVRSNVARRFQNRRLILFDMECR
jgi:hypothetical protein